MASSGTVMVLSVRIAIDALERRGIDAAGVLKAAHLSREALSSPENRVPYETAQHVWEAAAAAAKDEAFGIHVAEELAIGDYDIFDYIQAVASTVGEGLENLTRYVRLLYDRSNFTLVVEPLGARLTRRVQNPTPQRDEFTCAWVLTRSRQFSGTHWLPDFAALSAPESTAVIARSDTCSAAPASSAQPRPNCASHCRSCGCRTSTRIRGCSRSCCATRTGCLRRIREARGSLRRLAARLLGSWRGARPPWRPPPAPCAIPPGHCSAGWRPRG